MRVNIRHVKNWLLGLFGLVIILLAISFTLLRVAIKSVPDYTVAIQELASEKTGMTIEVGSLDAEIYWLVPRLNLLDVKISDETGKKLFLQMDQVALSLDWLGSLQTMMPVVGEIILSGVDLKVGINKRSQLLLQNYVVREDVNKKIQGVNISGPAKFATFEVSEEIKYIVNNLNVKILDSKLEFYDERHTHRNKKFDNFNLQLLNNIDEHVFEMKADLSEKYGKNIHLIIDVDGDLFDYTNLQGEMYLAVNGIQAAPWLDDYWDYFQFSASGEVDAQIWLSWDAQQITAVQSQLGLSEIALSYLDTSVNTWKLDKLDAGVQWEKKDTGWQLDVRDLRSVRNGVIRSESSSATIEMLDDRRELTLQADFLRIEGLVYMAGMGNSFFNEKLPWLDFLEKHQPSGRLELLDVSLPVDEPEDIEVNTRFSHISFILPESEPATVHNLQGTVVYLDKRTWLTLDSENTELKFNKLFRKTLNLNVLKGTLGISHKNHIWEFSTEVLKIETPYLSSLNRVRFVVPENGRVFLDLTTRLKSADVQYLSRYLPAGVMSSGTLEWLESSVLKGRLLNGAYQFYGYLGDAPFYAKQGVSLAEFDVVGANLSYLNGWPAVNDINAHLRIENDSVLLTGKSATVLNSKIRQAKVYIDNFTSPTLDFKGKVDIQLADIKNFVKQSSLHEKVGDYINNIELSGKGELDLELFLPLYGDYRTKLGGELKFDSGKLALIRENYELTELRGSVRFAGDTVESSALNAHLGGKLVDIDIATTRHQKGLSYDIGLTGNLPIQALLAPVPRVQGFFNGDTNWDILLNVRTQSDTKKTDIKITAASDLQGVSSQLPGRLGKLSAQAVPLKVNINIQPGTGSKYDLELNKTTHINVTDEGDQLLFSVDDESIRGEASYKPSASSGVALEIALEYLDLNKLLNTGAPPVEEEENDDEEEGIQSSAVSEKTAPTGAFAQRSGLSPRDIPSFRFSTKSLLWKKFKFNHATLKTRQTNLGMVVEKLDLVSSDYSVSATGNWLAGWNNKNTTKLDADIVISNLGRVFKQLELSDNLSRAPGKMSVAWQWQGAPYELDWSRLSGNGRLNLKEGTVKALNAGVGRVLGLLNFETLLSMDFGNQVSDGFTFDKVKSTFSFSKGNLYTDDFTIESKVADISMNGYLDIENELIDQRVTVTPNLDSTLSLGTAFVAGPTVGGIVYLFQKVFNTSSLSSYQYALKGKIDDPKVEVLSVPRTEDEEEDEFDF